jgi:hypothetical protein
MAIRTVLRRVLVSAVGLMMLAGWLLLMMLLGEELTPLVAGVWVGVGFAGLRLWSAQVQPLILRLLDARRRRLERALTDFQRSALDARSRDGVLERLENTVSEALGAQLVGLDDAPLATPVLRDLLGADEEELLTQLDRLHASMRRWRAAPKGWRRRCRCAPPSSRARSSS